jgi:MFS family permease
MFDAFEGQLFAVKGGVMLTDLLGTLSSDSEVKRWKDLLFVPFLLGGALGGIGFGSLADRIGRKPTMSLTILFYSVFSGLTYFATSLWQVAALRFLVALGVGGEWAVGAALVAEVFPTRARARASAIFHATSVLGTWLAAIAGIIVATNWRSIFVIGVLPAVLVFWVTAKVREPDTWRRAEESHQERGSLRALFGTPRWSKPAVLGMLLAAIGLGTFWSVTIAGQDLTKELLKRNGWDEDAADRSATFAYGIVETAGGGLGLLSFGPLAERFGRKWAFAALQIGALVVVPITCYLPQTYAQMLCVLPFYGFFTLGIHAGFAVYFPELFPNHLRATGAGVCFNGGRILSAPLMVLSSKLKGRSDVDLRLAVTLMGLLFFIGLFLLLFLPETKGRPLPE